MIVDVRSPPPAVQWRTLPAALPLGTQVAARSGNCPLLLRPRTWLSTWHRNAKAVEPLCSSGPRHSNTKAAEPPNLKLWPPCELKSGYATQQCQLQSTRAELNYTSATTLHHPAAPFPLPTHTRKVGSPPHEATRLQCRPSPSQRNRFFFHSGQLGSNTKGALDAEEAVASLGIASGGGTVSSLSSTSSSFQPPHGEFSGVHAGIVIQSPRGEDRSVTSTDARRHEGWRAAMPPLHQATIEVAGAAKPTPKETARLHNGVSS